MKNQNSIRSDIEYISRFFQRKGSRYILLVLDDERMLNYLIVSIQVELKKSKKEIVNLKLSNEEDDFSVYNRVKKFLGDTTCDGLIITNLNALIYRNSLQTIDLLNKSRDAFERFGLPMVFVVNSDNLKKIIHGAPDFYQLRELPDYHARGTGIWERIPSGIPGIEHTGFADLNLKAELLEEQIKISAEKDKIDEDLLNSLVIPLLKIYIDMSFYNKMKPLFNRYIKGREGDIKDRKVLDAYYRKMSELEKHPFFPGKPIYKYLRKKVEPPPLKDEVTPLDVERLLDSLSKAQLRLLKAAAIYRIPVKKEALLVHKVSIKPDDLAKLKDLSLLEYLKDDDMYYVHPLTAQYLLGKIRKDTRRRYHCRAAEYFNSIVYEDGKKDINNELEARWHYLQAGEWDRAAEVTFDLESYLTLHGFPQQSMELLKELEEKDLDEKNRSIVLHQMGILYQGFGDYDAALTRYQKAMEIKEKIGDIKGVSSSLHQIGMIYQDKGDYDAALTRYQKAMEIAEKIGDIKGVSDSLHQIGMIYEDKGDYDTALTQYQKAKNISEKIGDIKGVSKSLHQIGRIHQEKGDYDAALTQYQKSMEIDEKIGDIKGVSSSLHNIGMIYQYKDDYDAALTQYQKSMEIRKKIGDIKGVSSSLHQIGMLYQEKGDYDAALTQYQKSMEIKQKIGDIVGAARSNFDIGTLFFEQKQFEPALKLFCQDFLVLVKVGSPDAKKAAHNIALVGEKMTEERFVEILGKFQLTPDLFGKGEKEEEKLRS